jgi:arylsulfatase
MTGVATPNFNRLAREGMRLTNFNVAQAVCTASRAALLTGCYPNRLGISGAFLPGSKVALNPKEETLASVLKTNGYKTAMLGKWHLGNVYPYWPLQYGFDSFYGIPYSHDIWPIGYDGKRITDPQNIRSSWPALPVIRDNNVVDSILNLDQQSGWTQTLTRMAVDFIATQKNSPFFLYLAHPMPHVPVVVSPHFRGKSSIGLYGDVLLELDWSLGEIMDALEQNGLDKNTILIVTSDNGPWIQFGDRAGSPGGFKEGKGTAFEGGTRVPFLIRWPGRISAGAVSGELVTNMDLLPSLCKLTGTAPPQNKIDGIDCSDFLLGKNPESGRELFFYYYGGNQLKAVRYRHWKLVLPHQSQSYVEKGKDGFPGAVTFSRQVDTALFNLALDPAETYDVRELYPDVVQQLMGFVAEARLDMGDDLTNYRGSNRREPALIR